jgi:hypothetical protein
MKYSIGDNVYVLVNNGNRDVKFKGMIVNETKTPFEYLVWVETQPAILNAGSVSSNLIKLRSEFLELRTDEQTSK